MVGGAKASAAVKLGHPDMLFHGKRLVGVTGGDRTPAFHRSLTHLRGQGPFPLERLVRTCDFADVNPAIDDSESGTVVEPILTMR